MSTIHIDGDVVCYRAAAATEKTRYLLTDAEAGQIRGAADDAKSVEEFREYEDDLRWSRKDLQPVEEAELLVSLMLKNICARFPDHEKRVYMSPSVGNFREQIATRAKYKGNRDSTPRPTHHKALVNYLLTKNYTVAAVGMEADDAIGIAYQPGDVVASIDKDLKQIAGTHLNIHTGDVEEVSKVRAKKYHFEQTLSGDAADNVPGIAGIGPVKAQKLIAPAKSPKAAWDIVLDKYTEAFGAELGPKYALEAAQLTYILRKPGELWQPPA